MLISCAYNSVSPVKSNSTVKVMFFVSEMNMRVLLQTAAMLHFTLFMR